MVVVIKEEDVTKIMKANMLRRRMRILEEQIDALREELEKLRGEYESIGIQIE